MNCLGMQVACADKVGSASRGMGEAQETEEELLECTRASPIVCMLPASRRGPGYW